MKRFSRFLTAAVFSTSLAIAAPFTHAETIQFAAKMNAAKEVPPKNSLGQGHVVGTLDTNTNEFVYSVSFTALTGPVIAAHFHGPARAGANAGVQVPVNTSPISSPINGEVKLTAEQVKELKDGLWYFNLHTQANPSGEIRGQIIKQP